MVLLAAFVVAERRGSHPLLPLRVILDRARGGSYVAVFLSGIAIFGIFLFLTYYLQEVRGYSPVTSGLAFLPMVGCILLSSNVSSIVALPRLGPRALIVPGMLLGAAGMSYLTQLTVSSSYAGSVLPALLILGLGFGMIFAPAINTATAGVPRQDSGVASALVNTMQQVGGSIGVSALSTIALTATASYLAAHHTGPLAPASRGHPRVHRSLRGVRGNLRPRRDPRDHPAAIPAAARRTQGRRRSRPSRSSAPGRRTRVRTRARCRIRARRRAARRRPRRGLAPWLEVHAIPVALCGCSPVINHASLPAGRPAG